MADNDITHTAEIIKTVLPFVDVRTKTTMDLLVKLFELIGALRIFRRNRNIVSTNEHQAMDLEAMLTKVKPVCNDRERSFVDQMLSIFQAKRTMEMYNSYMSMMKSMEGGGEAGAGFGAENFASNLAGFDLSSIFGGNSKSDTSFGSNNGFPFGSASGIDLSSIFGTGTSIPNSFHSDTATSDASEDEENSEFEDNSGVSAAEALRAALEEALAASKKPSSDRQTSNSPEDPVKDSYTKVSYVDTLKAASSNAQTNPSTATDSAYSDSDSSKDSYGNQNKSSSKENTNKASSASSKSMLDDSDSDNSSNNSNSEDNGTMLHMLKNMIPPDQMNTFENLRMLFNNMSYDDNSKADQKKE